MSVVKVIEIIGTSEDSWEDAAEQAVKKAAQTVHNITGVEVLAQTAHVNGDRIENYRTTVHVAFELDE